MCAFKILQTLREGGCCNMPLTHLTILFLDKPPSLFIISQFILLG